MREKQNDIIAAFDFPIMAIKFNAKKDILHQNSIEQVFNLAKNIIEPKNALKGWLIL
jgi:hypothetical protein